SAGREQVEARDGDPFGARVGGAAGFAVTPSVAGAGVEQHAGDDEIEARRALLVWGGRGGVEPLLEGAGPVDPAGRQMPPAAVARDPPDVGIRSARHSHHPLGDLSESTFVDGPVVEGALESRRVESAAPLANSAWAPQIGGFGFVAGSRRPAIAPLVPRHDRLVIP